MFERIHPALEAVIGRLIDASQRHAIAVVVLALCATVASGAFVVQNVSINTDTTDMLSERLPWRQTYTVYKRDFPYFADTIAVVVDGHTPDIARDGAARLAAALEQEEALFEDVFYPAADPFVRRQQFLYLAPDALAALADDLAAAQPLLARLTNRPSSATLFDLLDEAFSAGNADAAAQLTPAVHHIARAIDTFNDGATLPMSWETLLGGDPNADAQSAREILLLKPHLDYGELLPAAPAMERIRQLAAELGLDAGHGVQVRLTGGAALSFDELTSVVDGSLDAAVLALVMVLACLALGLRSLVLMFATLITLLGGLILTAAFAVAFVGSLNMISIAFAVLYVGLGVDFAIHLCLRYRELLAYETPDAAVNYAARHVGVSLLLCAATTAIGFFAFIPTSYRGVAELGMISGAGMFISLAVSLIVLPALLHLLPRPQMRALTATLPDRVAAFPRLHARGILAGATIVWIVTSLMIPAVRFDRDPLNLNDQDAESVVTFRELLRDPDRSPNAIAAVLPAGTSLADTARTLTALPQVHGVRSVLDFVPDDQATKVALVEDLAFLLGADLDAPALPGPPGTEVRESLRRVLASSRSAGPVAAPLVEPLATLAQQLNGKSGAALDSAIAALDHKLLASFDGRVRALADGLYPTPFTSEDLPAAIARRWLTEDGRARIEVYPAGDLSGPADMRRFVAAVRDVVGDAATGIPVINIGAGDAVRQAFIEAFSYAFVIISLLLWLLLRSAKEVAIVLSPLILAGLVTAGASVVLAMPFNFANIIALPLLLGIGVDSALHILHRYKTALPINGNLLQTSTARAVLFSALTTTVSFGNLAVSPHAGTASMGVMLTIGVVSTVLCTLIVLPALLKQFVPVRLP